MHVNDTIHQLLVFTRVLQLYPLFDGSEIIANMRNPGRLNSREYAVLSACLQDNEKRNEKLIQEIPYATSRPYTYTNFCTAYVLVRNECNRETNALREHLMLKIIAV